VEANNTQSLGFVLANSAGQTLYLLTGDTSNHSNCTAIPCSLVWAPFTTTGAGVAGPGVEQSLLGTIELPDGDLQVTYAGHPLYTGGNGADDTSGEGSMLGEDGTAYAVAPATGQPIK